MNILITLEAARRNAGYSQKEVAKRLGVHYQTISAWEKDSSKMPYSMVMKISQIYKIPKENIFFGSKNEFIRISRRKTSNNTTTSKEA